MLETTLKDLQTAYAQISEKVKKQEDALSPDAIGAASVSDLAAANKEMMADVQALREKIEANKMTLPDGRQIFRHEYEALQQLARENGVEEEKVLESLAGAKIEGGQIKTIRLYYLPLSTVTRLEALTGLVELDLRYDALQGDPQFPALLKLQKLYLDRNQITGVSGLSHLTELTELNLNSNALQGDPQFPTLPKLRKLHLVDNEISGVSGLSLLTALTELRLGSNALRGDPQFPTLPRLQKLILNGNEITGVSGLSTLTGLKELFVDKNTKSHLQTELKELEQRGLTVHVL